MERSICIFDKGLTTTKMNSINADQTVRDLLISFLKDRHAHANSEDVLQDFPMEYINSKIENVEYSPWQLLEHMRLTQRDIIDFVEDTNYQTPDWPAAYWSERQQADSDIWNTSLQQFFDDIDHLERIVKDPNTDLYQSMPAGDKYSVFREILIVIDHNAHHLGQLILFRKHFGAWKK